MFMYSSLLILGDFFLKCVRVTCVKLWVFLYPVEIGPNQSNWFGTGSEQFWKQFQLVFRVGYFFGYFFQCGYFVIHLSDNTENRCCPRPACPNATQFSGLVSVARLEKITPFWENYASWYGRPNPED